MILDWIWRAASPKEYEAKHRAPDYIGDHGEGSWFETIEFNPINEGYVRKCTHYLSRKPIKVKVHYVDLILPPGSYVTVPVEMPELLLAEDLISRKEHRSYIPFPCEPKWKYPIERKIDRE